MFKWESTMVGNCGSENLGGQGKETKGLMIVPAEHMGGEEEKALVQDFQSNSFVFNGVGRVWKDKKKKGQIVVSYCKI